MAAIQKQRGSKIRTMMTCRPDELTRQPSNISNYEGYHGGETASIPFTWESQPGTPKLRSRGTTLPPLTPPPSYSYTTSATSTPNHSRSIVKAHKKNSSSKSNLLQTIFPKRTARKASAPPPPPPPSLSPANSSPSLSFSSSSCSSNSSYNSSSPRLRSRSVPASPMRFGRKEDEDEEDLYDVPASGTCFWRGCYTSMIKVLVGDFL